MKDTAAKLSPVSVSLHWLVGLAIIGMLALGIYMDENEAYELYDLHKSIGVVILPIAMLRVYWRLVNRWPLALSDDGAALRFIAHLVHWILILATLLMPISGAVMSAVGGHGLPLFGLELIAENPDPANPGQALAYSEAIAGFAHETHEIVANLVIVVLLLHIAGAVKHHVINKDGTLRRMLGREV